ncbi:MAG: hypothetical protein QM581_06925 [Pseudomonas sp.]
MSSRIPLHRAVVSRQHMRLAGAMVFDQRALAFHLRGTPRAVEAAPALDRFTRQALSLREARNARR